MAFSFSDNFASRLSIPFKYKEQKKDGTDMKKDSEIPVFASFCPFCGKSAIVENKNPA